MRKLSTLAVALLLMVAFTGCATKKYVKQETGAVGTRVDEVQGQVEEAQTRLDTQEKQIAALDSQPQPEKPTLLAEVDGHIVAAAPLAGGRSVADPFELIADVVELLESHARTLRHAA